jgi:hypothetical protein
VCPRLVPSSGKLEIGGSGGIEADNDNSYLYYGLTRTEDIAMFVNLDAWYDFRTGKDKGELPLFHAFAFHDADGSYNQKFFFESTSFTIEVKSWDPKNIDKFSSSYLDKLNKGVDQVVGNMKNLGRDNGILVIDRKAYLNLYNSNPEAVTEAINRLNDAGGYLKLETNLSANANKRLQSISSDIRKEAKKPAVGHY